jgi:monofunctional chorismate mutase
MPELPDNSKSSKGADRPAKGRTSSEGVFSELEALRNEIDRIDAALADLVKERIKLISQVVEIKERLELPTLDSEREKQVIAKLSANSQEPEFLVFIEALYAKIFELSREYQIKLRRRMKSSNRQ